MKTDNLLLIVAVIAVVISIVSAGITYNYITSLRNRLTGFASYGMINLTIEESAAINFTDNMLNWSSGRVSDGYDSALLDTTNDTDANVTGGNWTGVTHGLIVENIGNKNVSFFLKSTEDNESMIGGAADGGPLLRWKVTINDTEASCNFSGGGTVNNTWADVNKSGADPGTQFCDQFYFESNRDQLEIDFFLKIPQDSLTGDRGSTIIATFNSV